MLLDGKTRVVSAKTEGNALVVDLDELRSLAVACDYSTVETSEIEFFVSARKVTDLNWLITLLSLMCVLETIALIYTAGYYLRNKAMSVAPVLFAALIVPASGAYICAVLGAICLAEGAAIGVLLGAIVRRERKSRRQNA